MNISRSSKPVDSNEADNLHSLRPWKPKTLKGNQRNKM